jgi:hypothetical protein
MEVIEAATNESDDDLIQVTMAGDEEEWREIAAALRESDSDLATELGLKLREAVRNAGT